MTLPYLGEVRAAGLTVVELTSQLIERYREYYVEPSILVTLVSTGEGLRRLRSSLESAGSRATLVGPDGRIVLAYLEPMKASGLTLTEIQDEINERYRRAMPGVAVTVRLAGRR
jgi:polysaccharide export outer membrane protein